MADETVKVTPLSCHQATKDVEEIQEGIVRAKNIGKSAAKELQLIQEILLESFSIPKENGVAYDPDIASVSSINNGFSSSRLNFTDLNPKDKCRKSWINEDDDEETAILRRLNHENQGLLVQLDAAREALFSHQNKTQNHMDKIEEDFEDLRARLEQSMSREQTALGKIRSLEEALQEMQSEKQMIQRATSNSLEELSQSESRKQSELQGIVEKLHLDLEQKEEENIRLCMTILKVQEDLTKENHLKESGIEQRDNTIQRLERALTELRLDNESRDLKSTFDKNEFGHENEDVSSKESFDCLQAKLEEREEEISRLKKENQELKEMVLPLRGLSESPQETTTADVNLEESTQENAPIQKSPNESLTRKDEVGKLRERLRESEDTCRKAQERADHMTLLLNQKLIELNKLQLALSGQTKEMIQLEKAYFQLRNHLSKGYRTPSSSRSSSRGDLSIV